MIAIQTRFIPPTNYRCARVKAYTENKNQSLTVSWDDSLGQQGNHDRAAKRLIEKLGWRNHGPWYRGGSPDKRGETYVCAIPNNLVYFD